MGKEKGKELQQEKEHYLAVGKINSHS